MKKYYSTSRYANYAHIHMYVISKCFVSKLIKARLDSEGMYSIDANIDGNIVIWKIYAGDPRVEYVWNEIINNSDFINKKNIKIAVRDTAKAMHKKFEIIDLNLLVSEIKKIDFTKKMPKIKNDDDLFAPAIRFY